MSLAAVYPSLFHAFAALMKSIGTANSDNTLVYFTNSVKIHGFQYNIGCVIVTEYDHSGLPHFFLLCERFLFAMKRNSSFLKD